MSSSPFNGDSFKKREFKKLCYLIGFSQAQINNALENTASSYKQWSEEKYDKKTGKLKTYKDGTIKKRNFRNPSPLLKAVQSRIKSKVLSEIKLPDNVHGGVKGRSNITNAKPHQGNKCRFTTDLQEFYPNIKTKQVYEALIARGFSCHTSHWLTRLTTLDNEVPQGAPTSTAISNLVFFETDIKLINLCTQNEIVYTRYVDDLTFSSQKDFGHLIKAIITIVSDSHFKINYRKTKYSGMQPVTGIDIFLNKIDGTEKIIEKAKRESEENSQLKPISNYLNRIRRTNK